VKYWTRCQSLEASLSLSLEAFAGVELNEATRLRSKADVMSENAESSFSKHMHGRHSERANMAGGIGGDGFGGGMGGGGGGGGGNGMAMDALDQHYFVASWNKLSYHMGSRALRLNDSYTNIMIMYHLSTNSSRQFQLN